MAYISSNKFYPNQIIKSISYVLIREIPFNAVDITIKCKNIFLRIILRANSYKRDYAPACKFSNHPNSETKTKVVRIHNLHAFFCHFKEFSKIIFLRFKKLCSAPLQTRRDKNTMKPA